MSHTECSPVSHACVDVQIVCKMTKISTLVDVCEIYYKPLSNRKHNTLLPARRQSHSLKESTKLRQNNYSPLRAPATFGNDKHYTRKKCGQVTAKLKIQSKYKTGLKNPSLCYAEDYVTMYRKIILNKILLNTIHHISSKHNTKISPKPQYRPHAHTQEK